jgi:hypothetical protein
VTMELQRSLLPDPMCTSSVFSLWVTTELYEDLRLSEEGQLSGSK